MKRKGKLPLNRTLSSPDPEFVKYMKKMTKRKATGCRHKTFHAILKNDSGAFVISKVTYQSNGLDGWLWSNEIGGWCPSCGALKLKGEKRWRRAKNTSRR